MKTQSVSEPCAEAFHPAAGAAALVSRVLDALPAFTNLFSPAPQTRPAAAAPRESLFEQHLSQVAALVSRHGPEPHEYVALNEWFLEVHQQAAAGVFTPDELLALRQAFGDAMSAGTLQGFVCVKPHGYAGDFEIIDRIYRQHVSTDPKLTRWDRYFHTHAGPKAVRNRKDYFHGLLEQKLRMQDDRPLEVLVVGSGPGRDLREFLTAHPDARVNFECLDIDPRAIAHARELNREFADRVTFRQQNALRFRPSKTYDLVWAAGLFDYFSDRLFQMLVRRLIGAVAPGGELVIGNFSTANPSRAYMEFGEWHLQHRTAEALQELALGCGVTPDAVRVGSEPEGVNLFLHLTQLP